MGEIEYIEKIILSELEGKFINIDNDKKLKLIKIVAKNTDPSIDEITIQKILEDIDNLNPISKLLEDENIEDIMINNTKNIFVYDSKTGERKIDVKLNTIDDLNKFVAKLKLYQTNETAKGNVLDVHIPNGSRANIIASPLGYNITIRNFRKNVFSIIDLINLNELSYKIAARLWLYVDGFRIRPANILIGGMPAAGKTTLLNAMFSFFRPEQRIITMEETYELNTKTQENCVKLETNNTLKLEDLVKNSLRMRPDTMIIGEIRGEEANDMITAMNVGKIVMGTIHASSTRDMINRLIHRPMDVPIDIIPIIDSLIIVSQVYVNGKPVRKISQISEISGIENNKVLLSDLYSYDFKTEQESDVSPSITYRDLLSKIVGIPAKYIINEENIRAKILERMNQLGKTSIIEINNIVKKYYKNPKQTLIDLKLID